MATPLIISADQYKKYFPKYNPNKAEEFHQLSAQLVDKHFAAAIQYIPTSTIILSGGTASGKTEYLKEYLLHFGQNGGIFLDGTLPSFEGANIKIKNLIKYNREFEIHFIYPENLLKSYEIFLSRERKFNSSHFYRTHSNSRKTLLEISQKYPNIKIRIIQSKFLKQEKIMHFTKQNFHNSQTLIDFLQKLQITEKNLKQKIYDKN